MGRKVMTTDSRGCFPADTAFMDVQEAGWRIVVVRREE